MFGSEAPFNRLLTALYRAPLYPEYWNVFLEDFSSLTGVSRAALLSHDLGRKEHHLSATLGDSVKESTKPYEELYFQFDEWTSRIPASVAPGTVLCGEEVWPEAAMLKSVFYNEFLHKFDVCQMGAVIAFATPKLIDAFSIYRGPSEKPIDEDRLGLLRLLAPHLQTAFATRRRLSELEGKASDLEHVLDQTASAFVLIDVAGKAIYFTQEARRILDDQDGLLRNRKGLYTQNPSENSKLQEMITKAILGSRGKNFHRATAILISRSKRRPLHVFAAPFTTFETYGSSAAAILLITDPDRGRSLPGDILKQLYGLTKAESHLALLLINGSSLSEAASLASVTLETVRSQVKSILHKTGTRRQSELIQLLSALPTALG